MKICFWINSLFTLGGTKRVVTLIANELSKEHDVTIMCNESRHKEDRSMYNLNARVKVDFINIHEYADFDKRDFKTLRRKIIRKLNNKTGYFNTPYRCDKLGDALFPEEGRSSLAQYINQKGYDVVIAAARMALWLAMMTPYLQCKTVGWQHNNYDGYFHIPNILFWKKESLIKEFIPKLDAYVVLTELDQKAFNEKLGIQTTVRNNPRSFVSEKESSLKNKQFLMVTRFVNQKGLDLVVDSFDSFSKKDKDWNLVIVGSGELFNKTSKDINRRKLQNRIKLLGYTNNVQQYYLDSSVLLLPSRYEGWGLVIIEAYEYGLPVIAYDTGIIGILVKDGQTGLLAKPFDTKQYAEAMLKIAHNEELRRELGQNAANETEQYAIEKIGKEWIAFLHSL